MNRTLSRQMLALCMIYRALLSHMPCSSVLTSPTFVAGVSSGANAASSGGCVAVDPLTLSVLARTALGGVHANENRVAYVADSLPRSTIPSTDNHDIALRLGDKIRFSVSMRNDGWNTLSAANHSLRVSVSAVQLLMRLPSPFLGVGNARINMAGSPLLAALHRQGYAVLGSTSFFANEAAHVFSLPLDLFEAAVIDIPAAVTLPTLDIVCKAAVVASGDFCGEIAGLRVSNAGPRIAIVTVTYYLEGLQSESFAALPRNRDVLVHY